MTSHVEKRSFSRFVGRLAKKLFVQGEKKLAEAMSEGVDPLAERTMVDRLFDRMTASASTPEELFNSALILLGIIIATTKAAKHIADKQSQRRKHSAISSSEDDDKTASSKEKKKVKPPSVLSLQLRFLPTFWLIRLAFWMSGPYFYTVYASKTFHGVPASPTLINRIFLAGFGSIALLSPTMGRYLDRYGRKRGTIAAAAVYSLGALSTLSDRLWVLFAGRAVGGLGTNGISSAPEAWLVSESLTLKRNGDDPGGAYLRETFGLAYSYDPVVAICSGQIAQYAARWDGGPTGPFKVLPLCLAAGCLIAIFTWNENKAKPSASSEGGVKTTTASTTGGGGTTVQEGLQKILEDKKLLMLGAVQSLFESSMYIFLTQWPPAMTLAVKQYYGDDASVPFGTAFSCFMACCMVGSTFFTQFVACSNTIELHANVMLSAAALTMAAAAYFVFVSTTDVNNNANHHHLVGLVLSFFAFESCVGMYFPIFGILRSRYLPETHRSVIMSLFGIPLNVFVVTVFLFIGKLGTAGAFAVAAAGLAVATVCMYVLRRIRSREARRNLKRLVRKQMYVKMFTESAHSDSAGSRHGDDAYDANHDDRGSVKFNMPCM